MTCQESDKGMANFLLTSFLIKLHIAKQFCWLHTAYWRHFLSTSGFDGVKVQLCFTKYDFKPW